MIIWYGANGMTEALIILFLLLTARELVQWLADSDFRHLMAAGTYLALGYMSRYEMLAAGCAVVVFVAAITLWWSAGGRVERRQAAFADVLLVAAPLVAAFTLWAAASWVIVGHPFEQFSSQYGNSALVERGGGTSMIEPALLPVQWLVLAPLLPVVSIAVIVQAVRRRDLSIVPPVGVFLAVLAFEAVGVFRRLAVRVPALSDRCHPALRDARRLSPQGTAWPDSGVAAPRNGMASQRGIT